LHSNFCIVFLVLLPNPSVPPSRQLVLLPSSKHIILLVYGIQENRRGKATGIIIIITIAATTTAAAGPSPGPNFE
jgi:hypothetical protein